MREIKDPNEAETRTKEFISEKHWSIRKVFFSKTSRQEGAWLMEGQLWFGQFFFTFEKSFKPQLNARTGEVTFYEESADRRWKKLLV
jgi:hypothetical protein